MGALVSDVVCRKKPVLGDLKFITQAPLLRIGGTQINGKIDIHAACWKGFVFSGRKCSGKRIATGIAGIWRRQATRRAGNSNLISPRRGIGVLGVKERVRPVVENSVRRSNTLAPVSLGVPCQTYSRGKVIVLVLDVAVRNSRIPIEEDSRWRVGVLAGLCPGLESRL